MEKIDFEKFGFLEGLSEDHKQIVNEKMSELADYLVNNNVEDPWISVSSFAAVRRIWQHGARYVERDYSVRELVKRLKEWPEALRARYGDMDDFDAAVVATVSESFRTKDAPGSPKGDKKWRDIELAIKEKNKNNKPV